MMRYKYMVSADLSKLEPIFRHRVEQIIRDLTLLGWQPVVAEATRTPAQQAQKVKAGYSKTMQSWHVPGTTGILPLNRRSFDEVHGNAVDIVDKRYGWGGPASNTNFQFWQDLGRIAKRYGCEWGGDWKSFRDVAHIQFLYIETRPIDRAYA
jgi:hypothetical protein